MGRRLILGSRPVARFLLGYAHGEPVYRIAGAEEDKDAPTGDGDDKGTENDDDGDEDDSDDEENRTDSKNRRSRGNARSSEYNRIRRERNLLLKEKQDREKKDREAELADKSEVERVTAERDDAAKSRDTLLMENRDLKIRLAILSESSRKYNWADIDDVLNERKLLESIEVSPDGEITGIRDGLKDLAKRKPHYLLAKTEETGDAKNTGSNNGNGGSSNNANNGGGKTGGQPGSTGTNGDRTADRQRLASIYSALGPLVQ